MDSNKDIKAKEIKDATAGDFGFYQYVSLKIEKLTSATYLVTDFISDNEPLKWKLRSRSLDLLSGAAGLVKDNGFGGALSSGERTLVLTNEIVSLFTVGLSLSGISKMNFEVLREEYSRVAGQLEDHLGKNSLQDYLAVQNLRLPSRVEAAPAISSIAPLARPVSGEKGHIGQKDNRVETANDLYGLNKKDDKKSVRKEQIISWLKDKTWTSITEIAAAVPDCGPKTIQRELLEMVALGILKKQGERRWSRYMLKD